MRLWRYGRSIEQLGQRYRLEGVLGSGGMADVCLAWDERDEREVAIKVIKPDVLDQRTLDRFLKEAAQVANWNHPNILHIYSDLKLELLDASQGAIVPYIVMEYAQGGDLQKRLTNGQPYPLAATLDIFAQLCSAVAYAHEHGVIHRDLKPLNTLFRVLPDGSEQVVLSDFGLAVEMDATHHSFARGGTLPYMAPEQLQGHVEAASDIFALGVILYQLCTGRLPFRRSLQDLRRPDAFALPPAPSSIEPTLPESLDDAILTALIEDPAARFADANQFWDAVHASIPALPTSSNERTIPISRSAHTRILHNSSPYSTDPYPVGPHPATSSNHQTRMPAASNRSGLPPTQHSNHLDGFGVVPLISSNPDSSIPTSSKPDIDTDSHRAPINSRPASSIDIVNLVSGMHPAPVPNGPRPMSPMRPKPLARRSTNPTRQFPARRIIIASIALLVLLIAGGIVYFVPAIHNSLIASSPVFTVSITPDSQLTRQSYNIPANSVNAHQITISQSQSQTVHASGHKQTQATQAKGQLTFINAAFIAKKIVAGMTISGKDGSQLVTDADANIPPANVNAGTTSSIVVPAHAVNAGAKGNIPALDINQIYPSDNSIFVKNLNAFTGGQDPQDYNFVQQNDVAAEANPLTKTLTNQVQEGLKTHLAANEQMAGTPQCAPTVTTDPKNPVGDTGVNIPATTVSVSVQCSAEAYNKGLLQTQITSQLKSNTSPGPNYGLVGSAISQITVQDQGGQGNANLLVNVTGTWVYQISSEQQQKLAQRIANLTVAAAIKQLKSETGIRNVVIHGLPNDSQLPGDPARIPIVILNTGNS